MVNKINIRNKRASHDYEFIEKYTAGIVLSGTEIKSVRQGKANISDTFCYFRKGELWARNMHIAEYENRGYSNHDPASERKLLLNANELRKLARKGRDQGLTIIATRLFISESGYAKLNIALARGKRQYDKRQDIKKKDTQRENSRRMKL